MNLVPDATDSAHTWRPVDLGPVLDGERQRPQPTVGRRTDKVGLFYPGKVNAVSSETEAGKTWFAVSAAIDEMMDGNRVLYLDFEDDEIAIVDRLLVLGVHRDLIRGRFHYVRPLEPLRGINIVDLDIALAEIQPTLVIVDGITEAMTLHGLNPLKNDEISTFGQGLLSRLTVTGAAVVCLDHVTKDRENRGRYALGGVHKLNRIDGAAYMLENRTPFGIGVTGRSTIRIAKDRPAQLRRHALPSAGGMHWFGDLVLTSHGDEFAEVEVVPPVAKSDDDDWRPTALMAKISDAFVHAGQPLTGRGVTDRVQGNAANIRRALAFLVDDGYVTTEGGSRGATLHTLVRPYQPEES